MEIETKAVKEAETRAKLAAMSNEDLASLAMKPMTRAERRKWYRENKKKLGLPSWGELSSIKATEHGIES